MSLAEKAKKIVEELQNDPQYFWQFFDKEKKGEITFFEASKGVTEYMKLPEEFTLKSILSKAFTAAKTDSGDENNKLSKENFKYFLQYLRTYASYRMVFDEIDKNKDQKIALEEFKKAVPVLEARGITISDPNQTFSEIDTTKQGTILFQQFCDWAYSRHLTLDEVQKVKVLSNKEKYLEICQKLSRDPRELWPSFCVNKTKYLDFQQVNIGIKTQVPELSPLQPVIKLAFNDAKIALKPMTKQGDKYVSRGEFKYLLKYLRNYTYYWFIFKDMDVNGDLRISLEEFKDAIPCLKQLGLTILDAKKTFQKIDKDHNGKITFQEFCGWARYQLPA